VITTTRAAKFQRLPFQNLIGDRAEGPRQDFPRRDALREESSQGRLIAQPCRYLIQHAGKAAG
jgi:hypothetical protein